MKTNSGRKFKERINRLKRMAQHHERRVSLQTEAIKEISKILRIRSLKLEADQAELKALLMEIKLLKTEDKVGHQIEYVGRFNDEE